MEINKFTRKIICAALIILLVSGQTAFAADLPLVFVPISPPAIVTPVISTLPHSSPAVLSLHAAHYGTEQSAGDKFQNLNRGEFTNGNLESLTPPGRPAHQFTYTPLDLTEDYIAPNVRAGTTTNYLYNLDKQLTRVTRPAGQMLHLNYDTAGRLSTMTTPRGTSTYAYHPTSGNLSGITAPGGVGLSFNYDGALPLSTAWSGPVPGSVTNVFDNNFRVVSMSVNGGNPIAFGYDNDGLLTSAGILAIARNAGNGLPIGTTLGNVTDALTYNSFAEPQSYTASISGAQTFKTEYTRDALGRIIRKVETISGITDTYDYTYDAADRLAQVVKNGVVIEQYTYDANGNRSGGTYDDQDRLLGYDGNTYAYTANGDLLTKTAAGMTSTYDYDLLGNLMSVSLPNGTNIEYIVDGQNRRIGKKINGTLAQGFLYQDQLNPVAELDGSGNVVSRFVYGTKGNVPDYMIKGGVTYRIISDHLGSPRLIVDTATGTIAQRIDYDSFGNIISDTNPSFQPFGFAGGLYDQDTKLTRFGARDYDAEIGRWTSKDPILFLAGDTNLYGYVFNDPINLIDSLGLRGTFAENFQFAIKANNQFFFGGVTQLTRTAIGSFTAGAVARETGLRTFGMAASEFLRNQRTYAPELGMAGGAVIFELGGSVLAHGIYNAAVVTIGLEVGIIGGSLIDAAIQTFFIDDEVEGVCK